MITLKTEFIKYLQENYLGKITEDINNKLLELREDGILLRSEIIDLIALDSDYDEFIFKIKAQCEVLKTDGNFASYMFVSEYSCILDNGIKNFKLIEVIESKSNKFTYKEILTDCFIPYNKKEDYEKLAIRFLKYYFQSNFKEYPLDVITLIDKVGLKIHLSTNVNDSLGKTVFTDCDIQLVKDGPHIHVKKGSIVLNIKNFLLTGNNKLFRTTAVHECLHWHYHRKAFEIIMLLNSQYKYVDSTDYKQDDEDPIKSALAWMEIQAYSITKACMMLEENVRNQVGNAFNEINFMKVQGMDKIDYYYSIVSAISDTFETTLSDTIKRLSHLGYTEVDNLRNEFYDSFTNSVIHNERLNNNQTRRINKQIFNFMLENSPKLKLAIQSGLYVYADGFVVIKSPKYLIRIGDNYMLNTYARNHIEECSLIFNVRKDYKTRFDLTSVLQFITANSGVSNSTIIVGDVESYVIAPFMLQSILDQSEPIRSQILKNAYIYEDNLTFSDYFKHLIEKYGFTSVKDLMEATHCSRSVIENYRDFDDAAYSIEKVLSICAGMKLLPPESKHLIKKCGLIDLRSNSKRTKIYKYLIEECWNEGIEKWNKVLKANMIPALY